MRPSRGLGCFALALTLLGAAGASGDPAFRTVARSGRPAPGFPAGVKLDEFHAAVIDARGNVAFGASATTRDYTGSYVDAVWLAGPRGTTRLVLREDAKLRGFPDLLLEEPDGAPILTPDGTVVYHAGLRSKSDPRERLGVFLRAPLGRRLRPLVWPDSPARDAGSILDAMTGVRVGASGVAFMAPAARGGLDLDTLYVWDGNESPRAVVRIGDAVEGPRDPKVWRLRWSAPGPSGLPALVVETLSGAMLSWTLQIPDADGSYVERARSYEAPPAGPEGSRLSDLEFPWQNATGDVAIKGRVTLANPEPGRFEDTLLWVFQPDGSTDVIARVGDPAPGAPPGAVFTNFELRDFSDSGTALLRASIRGDGVGDTQTLGFWVHDPTSGLRLVFRNGDALACLPDHTDPWTAGLFAMNAGGTVVLPIESPDGDALVAFLPDGECVALIKQGDSVPIGRRGVKVLRDFELTGDATLPAYGGRFLNDAGELVFMARFEDGTEAVLVTAPIAHAPAE